MKVFDAGVGNSFNLSGCNFINGICIPPNDEAAEMIRNYISITKEPWEEVDYDETNPRHNPRASVSNIVMTDIVQTGMLAASSGNQNLTNAILNNSLEPSQEPSQTTSSGGLNIPKS